MTRRRRPPSLQSLLTHALKGATKPTAFVLAGHNGSGKSTLWYERLAPSLELPLVNADRLTGSLLPPSDPESNPLPDWAQRLRDEDVRWQSLAQEGVRAFISLVMERRMAFAFETVFSHWKKLPDGTYESKVDIIKDLQSAGYYVVLLFVGLVSSELSILRVATRFSQGGHNVPRGKLKTRFPRTQRAVGQAAPVADMTLMFDNSRGIKKAFALVRAQQRVQVLFDCRDLDYRVPDDLRAVAGVWLRQVVGPFSSPAA